MQKEELEKSDGFNPYNSDDTFSVQANDGVDNMYRPENSKGFTVGLNHDFENPYDVENLLNQNSTLQNAVRPASEVSIESVPEISYGGKMMIQILPTYRCRFFFRSITKYCQKTHK